MAVYTSIDMLEDCRAGRAEGWEYLVSRFLPALEWIARRHDEAAAGREGSLKGFLAALRDDARSPVNRFRTATDREFLYCAAEYWLDWAGALPADAGDRGIRERFGGALEEFTRLERQIVWFAVLGYDEDGMRELLPAAGERVRQVVARAAERLGGDAAVVSDRSYGAALVAEVRSSPPEEPVPLRRLFQVLDGRLDWRRRDEIEDRLLASWYELDRFCRAREAAMALRKARPLPPEQVAEYVRSLELDRRPPGGSRHSRPRGPRFLRLLPFLR